MAQCLENQLKHAKSNEEDNDSYELTGSTNDDFDPMTWTPLQDVIDAMPTFEISS